MAVTRPTLGLRSLGGVQSIGSFSARRATAHRDVSHAGGVRKAVVGGRPKKPFGEKPRLSLRWATRPSLELGRRAPARLGASGDEDSAGVAGDEELDTDKLMKELTDTSQLGGRGEAFFLAQMLLLFLLVFPPGGPDALGPELSEEIRKGFSDPLIGLALLVLAWLLVYKVRAEGGTGHGSGRQMAPSCGMKETGSLRSVVPPG